MDLESIKTLLSIEDDSKDEILTILLYAAMSAIQVYLGVEEFPQKLTFVAEQMTIIKYRRIGAEGIETEKIDVLSTKYVTDDFKPFKDILQNYKDNNLFGKRLKML